MGFKKMKTNLTFTDLSLFSSIEKNRAIKRMEQINKIVDWSRIDTLVMKNYPVGKSTAGHDAYPPSDSYEMPLLQQWLRIDSDPELETQIYPVKYSNFRLGFCI